MATSEALARVTAAGMLGVCTCSPAPSTQDTLTPLPARLVMPLIGLTALGDGLTLALPPPMFCGSIASPPSSAIVLSDDAVNGSTPVFLSNTVPCAATSRAVVTLAGVVTTDVDVPLRGRSNTPNLN